MKTPQEWAGESYIDEVTKVGIIQFIKNIQADAWLSATINASEIANKYADYDVTRDGRIIANEILEDKDLYENETGQREPRAIRDNGSYYYDVPEK